LLLRPVDVVEVLLLVGELVVVTVELERHVDKVLSSCVRTVCRKKIKLQTSYRCSKEWLSRSDKDEVFPFQEWRCVECVVVIKVESGGQKLPSKNPSASEGGRKVR
jgi:hypothetical protein